MELFISVLFALGFITNGKTIEIGNIFENKGAIEQYSLDHYGTSSDTYLKQIVKDENGNWYVPWDTEELLSN